MMLCKTYHWLHMGKAVLMYGRKQLASRMGPVSHSNQPTQQLQCKGHAFIPFCSGVSLCCFLASSLPFPLFCLPALSADPLTARSPLPPFFLAGGALAAPSNCALPALLLPVACALDPALPVAFGAKSAGSASACRFLPAFPPPFLLPSPCLESSSLCALPLPPDFKLVPALLGALGPAVGAFPLVLGAELVSKSPEVLTLLGLGLLALAWLACWGQYHLPRGTFSRPAQSLCMAMGHSFACSHETTLSEPLRPDFFFSWMPSCSPAVCAPPLQWCLSVLLDTCIQLTDCRASCRCRFKGICAGNRERKPSTFPFQEKGLAPSLNTRFEGPSSP